MTEKPRTFEGAIEDAASDILKMLMEAMADPEGGVGIDQVTALIDGHVRPTIAAKDRRIEELQARIDAVRVLAEKWDLIITAFTSPNYTVKKPMDAVQVLKDARRDVLTALGEPAAEMERKQP